MRKAKRIAATVVAVAGLGIVATGCGKSDADTASHNVSAKAERFEVERNIKFIDSLQGLVLLEIEGRCNIEHQSEGNHDQLEVICKVESGDGEDAFKKHFLGMPDNITYVVEQLDPVDVSEYHYSMVFKPQSLIPDIDTRISGDDTPFTEEGQQP